MLLVACQDQQGIHLKFLKKIGCLFLSVEKSKGFLQQGPAKGKRRDNDNCLEAGGGKEKEVSISRKSTWVLFAF